MNGWHYETAMCKDRVARKVQYAAAKHAHLALQQSFTAYSAELERVEVFKYLGRLLAYNDNDAQAVRGISRRHVASGRGSPARSGQKMHPPMCAAYFTKQPCNQYYCLEARHGICHQ
jgi:hypothetical protein